MEHTKLTKAEQARLNGAKSKGPKTDEGRRRMAASKTKHGLYSINASILDVESLDAFNQLRDAAFAQWRPRNPFEAQYVEEIADCSWRIARLRLCATNETNVSIRRLRQAAEHPIGHLDALTKAELDASTSQGAQTMIQRRINSLVRNRLQITSELRALQNVISMGTTQETLETQDLSKNTTDAQPADNQS